MRRQILLLVIFAFCLTATARELNAQAAKPDADTAAITALYGEWSKATAQRGAEGYVAFWAADGAAVLPPDGPAAEGREAIRQWITKVLETSTVKVTKFEPRKMIVSGNLATNRFVMAGERIPKNGGPPVKFHAKYLDVLQKQPDGKWVFLYRMWSDNGAM